MSTNNENIVHINAIEGLMSQVNEHLVDIKPEYPKQEKAVSAALEEVDLFQKTTLYILRTLCE